MLLTLWYVSTPQSAAGGLCKELSFHSVLTSQEENEMTQAVNLATSEKDTTDIKHNGHVMACEESTCCLSEICSAPWREHLSFVNNLHASVIKRKAMEQLKWGKEEETNDKYHCVCWCTLWYTTYRQLWSLLLHPQHVALCLVVVSSVLLCYDWSLAIPALDVLSEEQIRLKKLKKQEDDQARTVVVRPNPPNPPSPSHELTPEQLSMIEKLVAAQQQCNQRSFTDRLKVTVKTLPVYPK